MKLLASDELADAWQVLTRTGFANELLHPAELCLLDYVDVRQPPAGPADQLISDGGAPTGIP